MYGWRLTDHGPLAGCELSALMARNKSTGNSLTTAGSRITCRNLCVAVVTCKYFSKLSSKYFPNHLESTVSLRLSKSL